MRVIDRLVCASLLAVVLGGHLVVERVVVALDPEAAVRAAIERAGGSLERHGPEATLRGADGRMIADPWGRPIRWSPDPTVEPQGHA